ncbi:MAG: hypothetical protein DRJ65_12330 [Acidobacteria bacterium]|nr:MAG: hypothetical protein DRJ65_12330 [Acidobacteriota bacterium]
MEKPGYTLRMNAVRTVLLLLYLSPSLGMAAGEGLNNQPAETTTFNLENPAFPIHDPVHYTIKGLGLTCGHLYLSSSIEDLDGRPAYHIVMTAENSKFFNRIYKVDARIDSWVDAKTLSTLVYESVTTEKGETSTERHEIDLREGIVRSVENGVETTLEFSSTEPVLDPLAFVFRLQSLAKNGGDEITLTLLTTKGPVQTVTTVRGPKSKRTTRGRRLLLEIEPRPADGKMFSKKGLFSIWVDPQGPSTLYILDFKLSFGHLVAKID